MDKVGCQVMSIVLLPLICGSCATEGGILYGSKIELEAGSGDGNESNAESRAVLVDIYGFGRAGAANKWQGGRWSRGSRSPGLRSVDREPRAHADEVIEWTPQSSRCQVSSFRGRFLWASQGAAGGMERRQRKEGCAVHGAGMCNRHLFGGSLRHGACVGKSRKSELGVK
jgi:hypothetical protein